jgi:flagellar hook-associated protein 3 FlgL
VNLRTEMSRLSKELASGQTADVREVLAGNFSYLNDVESDLRKLEGYRVASTEARLYVESVDLQLERISSVSFKMGNDLLALGTLPVGPTLTQGAEEARGLLDQLVAELNAEVSGRSLFGGTATDRNPMASASDLLAALEVAISGAVTPADVRADAQAWFDSATGFEATIYQGATDGLAPFRMSDSEDINLDIRADDPVFRTTLMNVAIVALSDSATLGYPNDMIKTLQYESGADLIARQQEIIALRGTVGANLERIETIITRNEVSRSTLDLAKQEFLAVDPFEAATKLEDVQFRLQSVYAVTASSANLSLVNFL